MCKIRWERIELPMGTHELMILPLEWGWQIYESCNFFWIRRTLFLVFLDVDWQQQHRHMEFYSHSRIKLKIGSGSYPWWWRWWCDGAQLPHRLNIHIVNHSKCQELCVCSNFKATGEFNFLPLIYLIRCHFSAPLLVACCWLPTRLPISFRMP